MNIRVAFDGEEESGGTAISDWVAADDGPADACLILDGGMTERDKPEFTIATRGLIAFDITRPHGAERSALGHVRQRRSERDPRADRVPVGDLAARRAAARAAAGRESPSRRRRSSPPGRSSSPAPRSSPTPGSRPTTSGPAEEFYRRTWAEPSAEINGIHAGKPILNTTLDLQRACELHAAARTRPGSRRDRRRGEEADRGAQRRPGRRSSSSTSAAAGRAWSIPTLPRIQLGARCVRARDAASDRCSCAQAARCPCSRRSSIADVPTIMTGFGAARVERPCAERAPAGGVRPARHPRRARAVRLARRAALAR